MKFILGIIVVLGCVVGGFVLENGKLIILAQPVELLIIFGAAVGAFIIANPPSNIKKVIKYLGKVIGGKRNTKEDFLELLTILYNLFKLDKTKGTLQLESHVDNPESSSIFSRYPNFLANQVATDFLCDTIRAVTMGITNAHLIDDLMDEELATFKKETSDIFSAVETMADGMPALGIVAAVLGVINTMGAINEPPETLGHLIGVALVGTFLGVLLAYGFIAPIGNAMKKVTIDEKSYLECIKVGINAHLSGCAPAISVEFARKSIFLDVRPTFKELDSTINNIN